MIYCVLKFIYLLSVPFKLNIFKIFYIFFSKYLIKFVFVHQLIRMDPSKYQNVLVYPNDIPRFDNLTTPPQNKHLITSPRQQLRQTSPP
jgi:hypothetical protein